MFQTEGGTSTRGEYARTVASFDALSAAGVARGGAPATVFVGGLDPSVRESDLCRVFEKMGALTYVKIPRGRGCGFVQFEARASAETAIAALNGARVGAAGSKMRLSWVRANNPTYARGGARGFPGAGTRERRGRFVLRRRVSSRDARDGDGDGDGVLRFGKLLLPGAGGRVDGARRGMDPGVARRAPGRVRAKRSGTFRGFHPPAFASGPEASYAFAQQQYFAAQQRVPFERAAEFQTDPHTAAAAPASAARGSRAAAAGLRAKRRWPPGESAAA